MNRWVFTLLLSLTLSSFVRADLADRAFFQSLTGVFSGEGQVGLTGKLETVDSRIHAKPGEGGRFVLEGDMANASGLSFFSVVFKPGEGNAIVAEFTNSADEETELTGEVNDLEKSVKLKSKDREIEVRMNGDQVNFVMKHQGKGRVFETRLNLTREKK